MVLDLHEDLGSRSIQRGVVVELRRRGLRRASNLSWTIVTWRLFPLPLLLLPFFALFLIRRVGHRGLSGRQGLLDIRILLRTREHLEKVDGKLFFQTEKESRGLEGIFHGRHDDHLIQVGHLQGGDVEPGDEFSEGLIFPLLHPDQHI